MDALQATISESVNQTKSVLVNILHRISCECDSCSYNRENLRSLADFTYSPLGPYDEENGHFEDEFYSNIEVTLFDIRKTRFSSYQNEKIQPVASLRKKYADWGEYNITGGGKSLDGIDFLYRKVPINWAEYPYLNLPVPRQSGDREVAFIENSDSFSVSSDELFENERYNRIQKQNFKFSIMQRHIELSVQITGFYRGPQQYGNRRSWSDIWKLLQSDRSSIPNFVRRLCVESNTDHTYFLRFMKNEITLLHKNLRLDNEKIWEENQSEYIQVKN